MNNNARVYVGNLPMDIRQRDVEDLFYKYGRIRDIELKQPARPPAFAFVAFDDPRDAQDAVRGRDGYEMDGTRLRVEIAKGQRDRRDDRGGGGRGGAGRRTEYRVIITSLPPSASWQDLKDHMRQAGDVVYTDVDRMGGGIVEFAKREDMEYALRKLDDTEFRNPFDRSYIRVKLPRDAAPGGGGRGGSRSRSRSPGRGGGGGDRGGSRDRGRSPSRSRSRSRDRKGGGGGGGRGASRSVSRSRSRSRGRRDSSAPRDDGPAKEEETNGGGGERMDDDGGRDDPPAEVPKEGKEDADDKEGDAGDDRD